MPLFQPHNRPDDKIFLWTQARRCCNARQRADDATNAGLTMLEHTTSLQPRRRICTGRRRDFAAHSPIDFTICSQLDGAAAPSSQDAVVATPQTGVPDLNAVPRRPRHRVCSGHGCNCSATPRWVPRGGSRFGNPWRCRNRRFHQDVARSNFQANPVHVTGPHKPGSQGGDGLIWTSHAPITPES
jgi:hypothetical protein